MRHPKVHNFDKPRFFEWKIEGLIPSQKYQYKVVFNPKSILGTDLPGETIQEGFFRTKKAKGEPFKVAIFTDSHIGPFKDKARRLRILNRVGSLIAEETPDLAFALGDNVGWPKSKRQVKRRSSVIKAYSMYREALRPIVNSTSYFGLIGNWEGENGIIPPNERQIAIDVRKKYAPGPDHTTYPMGGSQNQDYYALEWGDALFVTLNVQTYSVPSKPSQEIESYLEVASIKDWTLGENQWKWLKATLAASTQPYKFIFIHHAIGGNGGNMRESLYGRGGGRAFNIGEQKILHDLMKKHGVQTMFYGHDHVFTDMKVESIHYTLPGSAGMTKKFGKHWTGYHKYRKDSGFAMLSIEKQHAEVKFINLKGKTFYSYRLYPNDHTKSQYSRKIQTKKSKNL